MWDRAKMAGLVEDLKRKDAALGIKSYQLKQVSFINKQYEKKLIGILGAEAFYNFMKDVMTEAMEHDLDFLDEDEEFDEILEDLKCSLNTLWNVNNK